MYLPLRIKTRMTPEEAEEVLRRFVRPKGSFLHDLKGPGEWSDHAGRPFIGRVSENRFKFHRFITGRDSFLPIISGRITPVEGGAELRGAMRLHLSVAIFVIAWLAIWSSVTLKTLPRAVQTGDVTGVIMTFAVPLILVGLAVLRFVSERRDTMRLLSKAFTRDEIE